MCYETETYMKQIWNYWPKNVLKINEAISYLVYWNEIYSTDFLKLFNK